MNKFRTESRIGGRIGNLEIKVPSSVVVTVLESCIEMKSESGSVTCERLKFLNYSHSDGKLKLHLLDDTVKHHVAMHGTHRQILNNFVQYLDKPYTRSIKLVGVGYFAEDAGENLKLFVGFSHNLLIPKKHGIHYSIVNKTTVVLSGIDKQLINNEIFSIQARRKPNAYDGKGIQVEGQIIRLKAKKK